MVQIQFLDKDVIHALIPAFSMEPEHIVFMYDRRCVDERYIKNIRVAINARLRHTMIGFIHADRFDVRDIKNQLLTCIADYKEEKICIDITGGSELMTACGMIMSLKNGFQIVYSNLTKGIIYDVMTGEKVTEIQHITVDDYLLAIGAKRVRHSHTLPKQKEYDAICRMSEYLFDHLGEWHALQRYLSDRYADSESLDFEITTSLFYNGNDYDSAKALSRFVENGFVDRRGHNQYRFKNLRYKEYMMIFGVWLEMYVYIKAQTFFDESHLGFIIDWNNADNEDTVDNEIDVLVMRKSVPIFISCKMRKPQPEDVFEVAYLADRLGGPGAKAIIATTYHVAGDKNLPDGIYQRLKKMHVGCIETDSFKGHTVSQIFNTAIQGAE